MGVTVLGWRSNLRSEFRFRCDLEASMDLKRVSRYCDAILRSCSSRSRLSRRLLQEVLCRSLRQNPLATLVARVRTKIITDAEALGLMHAVDLGKFLRGEYRQLITVREQVDVNQCEPVRPQSIAQQAQ